MINLPKQCPIHRGCGIYVTCTGPDGGVMSTVEGVWGCLNVPNVKQGLKSVPNVKARQKARRALRSIWHALDKWEATQKSTRDSQLNSIGRIFAFSMHFVQIFAPGGYLASFHLFWVSFSAELPTMAQKYVQHTLL